MCRLSLVTAPPLLALGLLGVRASGSPGRFHCETVTCALQDEWVPLNFTNSTQLCLDAHEAVLSGLVAEAPQRCRGRYPWTDCRRQYCDAFERALRTVSHLGGPGFHGGEECRQFLAFNRTLCETHYRDADAFCDCLCPTMRHFTPQHTCEEEIMKFLVLGRRGGAFAQNYSVRPYCVPFLCQWFEKIGDPNPPYPTEGVPATCGAIHLPFRTGQCAQLILRTPYNPCPWDTPNSRDDLLKCSDQTEHLVDDRHADTWSVCGEHDYRWQCPRNYPVMCSGRHCIGSSDHCCEVDVSECRAGRARECSQALTTELPEWRGLLTPAAAAARVTTTTLDPMEEYYARQVPEAEESSFAEWVTPWLPYIIGGAAAAGLVCTVGVCLCICSQHTKFIRKSIYGVPRLLRAIRSDPVSVFMPSGALPKGYEPELPPLKVRPWQEVEAERLERAACSGLLAAVRAAEGRGLSHVGAAAEPPALAEAARLRRAAEEVRRRGLQERGGNAELLARAERWLATLEAERRLFGAMEAARPLLGALGQPATAPPLPGTPWHATRAGRAAEGEVQRRAWQQVEALAEALRAARAEGVGASEALAAAAAGLLAQLVARTPELPADRCVLDPEGEGLRLLPAGSRRAVWLQTGEPYVYQPGSQSAGGLGEALPPREQLGDVGVDDARPVCAEWAQRRSCRAGRRCPWRHVAPQAGDSIRECVMCEDF